MILLKVHDTSWEDYIKSLSNSARKNWAYVRKHNKDLSYSMVAYDRRTMEWFMKMWEEQPIRGVKRQWAFPVDHVESLEKAGRLRVFLAEKRLTLDGGASSELVKPEPLSLHFVQTHQDGYIECHPPMWEKNEENTKRYLAKFMWFNLVKYAIENSSVGMRWIDFGGGYDTSWRLMIRERKNFPNPRYKWAYIPEEVKRNPDKQPDFTIQVNDGMRKLEEI